jgi:hypothetical protein
MRTYSLERLLIAAITAPAHVISTVEKLTRPKDLRRHIPQVSAEEPDFGPYHHPEHFADDRGTGCINDGEPQQVTLSGGEYERYLCGALNKPYEPAPDDDPTTCYFCGAETDNLIETDHGQEYVCEKCCAPVEDALSNIPRGDPGPADDRDGVLAQLCQLTYFVEDIRNLLGGSSATSPGLVDSPPEEGGHTPEPPPGGRPTSELLHDGATAIEQWMKGNLSPIGYNSDLWLATAAEMRTRANAFDAVNEKLQK